MHVLTGKKKTIIYSTGNLGLYPGYCASYDECEERTALDHRIKDQIFSQELLLTTTNFHSWLVCSADIF